MALTSARFKSSTKLRNAARDRPPLREGARGRAVHLLQFALRDLGYALPKSSRSRRYNPDGVFGKETAETVKAFQRSRALKPDGVVGKNTMQALDSEFAEPSHAVWLHFRSLSRKERTFEDTFRAARTVYGQYGIDLRFGSGESLLLTSAEAAIYERIDSDCKWEMTDGEFHELHGLGSPCPSNHVLVYFVRRINGLLGCGGHSPGRPAITAADRPWRWVMPHELGHLLLSKTFRPTHHGHGRNLLYRLPPDTPWIRVLTYRQVQQMRKHPCCLGA